MINSYVIMSWVLSYRIHYNILYIIIVIKINDVYIMIMQVI